MSGDWPPAGTAIRLPVRATLAAPGGGDIPQGMETRTLSMQPFQRAVAEMPNDWRFRSGGEAGMLGSDADPAPQFEANRRRQASIADLIEAGQAQSARTHQLCVIRDARREGQHPPAADHLNIDDQGEAAVGIFRQQPGADPCRLPEARRDAALRDSDAARRGLSLPSRHDPWKRPC